MARLLIIEDPSVSLRLTIFLLELAGHTALHAADRETGLMMAQRDQPDLILVDLELPDMDGFQAAARLKRVAGTRIIPVIALSARSMSQDRARMRSAGCDGFITKPASPQGFLAAIAAHLSTHSPAALPTARAGSQPGRGEDGFAAPGTNGTGTPRVGLWSRVEARLPS